MDIGTPEHKPFHIIDPRQRRVYERLVRLVDPCAAAFYRDAVELMETKPPYHSISHIVGHLIREVESAIRSMLEPLSITYSTITDNGETTKDNQKESVLLICKALGFKETDTLVKLWLGFCGNFHARAHRVAGSPPRPVDEGFLEWWHDVQDVFDGVLARQETKFLDYVSILDKLLEKDKPADKDVKVLKNQIPHTPVALRYFFERLNSYYWLIPLQKAGFFSHPPGIRHDVERGTISYPIWPQAHYLARVSPQSPEEVRDIISKIPDTENIHVLHDLIEAVSGMPAGVAKDLVPKVSSWLEKPLGLMPSDNLGKLLVKLAQEREVQCALELAGSLLRVEPSPQNSLAKVQSHINTWNYEKILSDSIPHLVTMIGIPALELLCNLLDQALSISISDASRKSGDDHSYIWYEAVEDDRNSSRGDIRDLLVGAVRDAAVSIATNRIVSTSKVVRTLENRRWRIFRRIALHVLRVSPQPPMSKIAKLLTGKRRFDRVGSYEHEYTLLLKQYFGKIKPAYQGKIITWIAEGPSQVDLRSFKNWRGGQVTDKDIAEYVNQWRYLRLALIEDNLPVEWHKQYAELKQEYVDIQGLDAHIRPQAGFVDYLSPKSADELNLMPIVELIDYLENWQDEGYFNRPSCKGLAETLTKAAIISPERYANEAYLFHKLSKPGYISALLYGFQSAIDQNKQFDWMQILKLCQWIANHPIAPQIHANVRDGWESVHYSVVRLIEKAFQKSPPYLAIDLRKEAWDAIEPIVMHQDKEENPNMDTDPSSSYDSIRSEALEAVIHYALWIYRYTYGDDSEACCSFDIMPEVRKALDYCLDTEHDSSTSVRMVYGRLFPQLVLLDREWVNTSINSIFPRSEEEKHLRDAAWNSYMKFCHPSSNLFEILADEYKWAVDRLAVGDTIDGYFGKSDDNLAEHLMVFYWWGKIDLSKDGLIATFFRNAKDELRSHAISFIGISVSNTEGSILESIINRLKKLWEFRIFEIRTSSTSKSYHKEISKFGWWFTSEKFPHEWALEQTHDVIKLVHWIEPESKVFDRLVNNVITAPETVLDCIEYVIEGSSDMERWRLDSIIKPAHAILKAALTNELVKNRAIELINRFGAQGYIKEFRDLSGT